MCILECNKSDKIGPSYLVISRVELCILSLYGLVQSEDGLLRAETCSCFEVVNKHVLCLTDICW